MGAYGVALLAKQQYEANMDMDYNSTILGLTDLENLKVDISHVRCNKCENHCLLTINKFNAWNFGCM